MRLHLYTEHRSFKPVQSLKARCDKEIWIYGPVYIQFGTYNVQKWKIRFILWFTAVKNMRDIKKKFQIKVVYN